MAALAGLGRHGEALRQYQLASEALRAELGVAPGAETERLLLEIRARRTAAPAAAARPEPEAAALPPPAAFARDDDRDDDREGARADEPVGREVEQRQIEGLLQGCKSSGRGHVILVRGEAGMGKSTFLRAALDRARAAGFATHLVLAGEYGDRRNRRGGARACSARSRRPEHTPRPHRLAVDELLGNPLDSAEAGLADALDPEARAQAHGRALEALVAAAGARQARVIAVEDLHWCDAETVRLLCAMAGAAPSARHRGRVHLPLGRGARRSRLDRAGAQGVPHLLRPRAAGRRRGRAPGGPLPAAGPGGDPPAASSAPRATRCSSCSCSRAGPRATAVPQSVQAAVLARLARVAPSDRDLLAAAAVLAAPFTLEQMARLLEQDVVPPATLVQQGWLRPAGARLAIAHDLVAAAIRSALDGATLARLHRRAAEWFAPRQPLTSAEHLALAGDRGAAGAYLSVAREALRERRLDLAESVLDRVDACPAEPALAFEAVCLRGDVRRERGDAAGSHAVFARALEQGRAPEQQVRARLGLAAALRLLDRFEEALALLVQADAAIPADDHATRAPLEYLRGNLFFSTGDVSGCRGAHQRALAHARQADSAVDEVAALNGLGDAHFLAGRPESAGRAFEASRRLARAQGLLRMEAGCGLMLGLTELYANQLAAGLRCRRARARAGRSDRRPAPAEPGGVGGDVPLPGAGRLAGRAALRRPRADLGAAAGLRAARGDGPRGAGPSSWWRRATGARR